MQQIPGPGPRGYCGGRTLWGGRYSPTPVCNLYMRELSFNWESQVLSLAVCRIEWPIAQAQCMNRVIPFFQGPASDEVDIKLKCVGGEKAE